MVKLKQFLYSSFAIQQFIITNDIILYSYYIFNTLGCFDPKEVLPLYRDIASLELLTLVIVKISKNEDLWDRFFKFLIYASKIPDRLLLDHEMLVC
jgi:hypothetical protein